MDFNSWIADLREVLQGQDNPLALRNGNWEVINRKVLWDAVGSRIFDAHLDRFKDCAVVVLKEVDPQFELHVNERYAASTHGKVLKHSPSLRKGMAETLALLGNYGAILTNCSNHKPESIAVLSLREILENADWKLWGSLNDLLPTLAEAAPSEFLHVVEGALRQTPGPFDELFVQEGTGITGRNYMTGLLWALEGLAWSEDYLVRVAVILAELASQDPGGNCANRPANSLTEILLPWFPQTLAPIHKRIAAIKAIRTDFPDVAWKVILSLLPNQYQTSTGTHKPRWSNILPVDWKPSVTHKEYFDQVTGYAELAVEMARDDFNRLKEIVGNLDNLPEASFDIFLEYLSSSAITQLPENDRLPIWSSLMEFARKHRRFSDAEWALDDETVARIEAAAIRLMPTSPEGLYRNLFSNRVLDLYEENDNWEAQHKKLDERRKKAIEEIMKASGVQGIIAFVDTVEAPNQVGWGMGIIATAEIDLELLPKYLDVNNVKNKQFGAGYVWSRYRSKGWQWVDKLDRSHWSLIQSCQFLIYLPLEENTWRRASEWLGDSEDMYWQQVPVNPYASDSDLLFAIDKLLSVARPQAAIDCLHYRLYKKLPLDNKRTVSALMDAVSVKEPAKAMDAHNIIDLVKVLQNDPTTEEGDLFSVEWAYLPLLDWYKVVPKSLEKRLATQPEFFCEVIRLIYRSKDEDKQWQSEKPDEQKKAIAANAWRLFHEWKRPPGLQEDGTFSSQDFGAWLERVKKQCAESGHLEVALITVGGVLFHCPADPNGLWIAQPVAKALNALDAEEMRSGFRTKVFNSRGVHRVDPTGKPELELAAQWREKADAVENSGFARFAATLKNLAGSYKRDAERVVREHNEP